jgi:hypothetical protein
MSCSVVESNDGTEFMSSYVILEIPDTIPVSILNLLRRAVNSMKSYAIPRGMMEIKESLNNKMHESIKYNRDMQTLIMDSFNPIPIDPEDYKSEDQIKMSIDVTNTTNKMYFITSKDISVIRNETRIYPYKKESFIFELLPNESFTYNGLAVLGTGMEHSRWKSCATISYEIRENNTSLFKIFGAIYCDEITLLLRIIKLCVNKINNLGIILVNRYSNNECITSENKVAFTFTHNDDDKDSTYYDPLIVEMRSHNDVIMAARDVVDEKQVIYFDVKCPNNKKNITKIINESVKNLTDKLLELQEMVSNITSDNNATNNSNSDKKEKKSKKKKNQSTDRESKENLVKKANKKKN